MEKTSESDTELIQHEICGAVKTAPYELWQLKRRKRYALVYNLFQKSSNDKNLHTINEEAILECLIEKTSFLKCSSLGTSYAMLKYTINIYNKNYKDISR